MAGTPNIKFNSGGIPHGGLYVDIYRPNDPENPNNGGTKLGTYLVESCSPKRGGGLTKRPDIDAGPNGFFIVGQDEEGSAVIQRNVAATPTVDNGDYFDAYLSVDQNGAQVAARYVIQSPDHTADASYRKMSCSVIVDKFATGVVPRNPLNSN